MTNPAPDAPAPKPVRKRHVFYIPGLDPAGGRRYLRTYKTQGARQAAISGYDLQVTELSQTDARYAWEVTATMDGQTTRTTIDYLAWNDLVRKNLSKSQLVSYWLMLRALWIYLMSGTLLAIYRTRPAMLITVLYPIVLYLLFPLVGVAAGWALHALVSLIVPLPGWTLWAALLGGLAAILMIFRHYDKRLFVSYLILSYAYISFNRGGPPPGLYERGEAFVEQIAQALASDADEVLLVGHSAGAGIGISLCAMLLRGGHVPEGKLSLLCIGSVTQLLSYLPQAGWLRANMNLCAKTPHLAWAEVTAPADGMCFALADPVATTGVDPDPSEKYWPVVFSAAFKETLSEATRTAKNFTFFRRHFQYIYAFDNPRDYDYFRITAGPVSLMDRYGARPSSASRITKASNRHTDHAEPEPAHGR